MDKELIVSTGFHNGAMSYFVNGKVQPFTSFKINENPDTEAMLKSAEIEIPQMAKQGIMHCWIPVFLDWSAPGKYDFSDMDKRINTVLDLYDKNTPPGKEKAVIVVRIQAAVFSPPWYVNGMMKKDGNSARLIEFRNPWGLAEPGKITDEMRFATRIKGYGSTYAISPGDKFWDTYALDCLEAAVDHVRSQPYASRVFGWLPCAFSTNEWFIHSDSPESCCDFSKSTQEAFREYLRGKNIECSESPTPLPETCFRGENVFLDTEKTEERIVEEFSLWINNRIPEIIEKFVSLIKGSYKDKNKLVGVFYGYTSELSGIHNLAQSGHLGLKRLLKNENIDFFCSPCQYRYRADESPFTFNQVLGAFANSAALCGKIAFAEDDHFPVFPQSPTRDQWHDEMFFLRNFAQVLTHGQHMWWYSLMPQWFKDEYRQKIIGTLHEIGIKALEKNRSPVAEIAVIADERSVSAMRLNPDLQRELLLQSYASCYPAGAPFEFYEINSFLEHADHSRFKVVFFLNLFQINDELEKKIEKLKSDGRTLIFQFAPGFLKETLCGKIFSRESASSLTGINLKEERDAQKLAVWVDPEKSALKVEKDMRYGWLSGPNPVSPVLYVGDSKAETMGYLYSGNSGFARKKHKGWTSVFSSAPNMPPEILRSLFKDAGVHIYTSCDDVVYASKSVVAYVSSSRGEKFLCMPEKARLKNIFTGKCIETDHENKCNFFLKRHETVIFEIL